MRSIKLIALLTIVLRSMAFGQLVINEVSSKNDSTITAPDGKYYDWIELYNSGTDTIQLNGFHLSDDSLQPSKWTFGDYLIYPNQHMLVFASDNDISTIPMTPDTSYDMNNIGYAYADNTDNPPGTSSIIYTEFSGSTFGTDGGEPILAGKINLAPPGGLGYSYAGIFMLFDNWNVYVDRSMYNGLNVVARIDSGKTLDLRFSSEGVDNWLNHTVSLTGTGGYEDYNIPLNGDIGLLDLTRLSGIEFIGVPPYDTVEVRVLKANFYHTGYNFHTNFKLSSSGDVLVLSDTAGAELDKMVIPALKTDISFGRENDGDNNLIVFTSPTPGWTNNGAESFPGYCYDTVHFDKAAGWYQSGELLTLSGAGQIRFTTDGSKPTSSSTLYSGPFTLDSTVVIRAACFNGASQPFSLQTNSYFIADSSELDVFSISTHPDNFFDEHIGIYVHGPNADTVNYPYFGSNFWEDWEREIHIEYFNKSGNKVFEQDADVEIFGGYSRGAPMKSLKLKAKSKYSNNHFDYKFFEDNPVTSFKHLILRNSGGDFCQSHFLDASNHIVLGDIVDIDRQSYLPTLVYINGEYMGIHNLRERMSQHYVEEHHGYQEDEIMLLEAWGTPIVGGPSDFWALESSIMSADMTNQSTYESLISNFDFDSYIDHFATNIYMANWDWPQNNTKLWKPNAAGGKYRYLMYDTDLTFGLFGFIPKDSNTVERILVAPDANSHMFAGFLGNEGFRNYFVNRSADLMNTVYLPDNFKNLIQSLRDTIAPEMGRHLEKWPWNSLSGWDDKINDMRVFVEDRPALHRQHIVDAFNLVKPVEITLDVSPAGAGVIKISTIVPESFPWSGHYFDGVPVEIVAIANPGYTFDHWDSDNLTLPNSTTARLNMNIDVDNSLTAFFTGSPAVADVIFSEINYNDQDDGTEGDWVELYNNGTTAVDISEWSFMDQNDVYKIKANTILAPDEYVVLAKNLSFFQTKYPGISNLQGDYDFKLSNNGEQLSLLDRDENIMTTLTYDELAPWPILANGSGWTMELVDYDGDQTQASNWTIGCKDGSPGMAYDASCPVLNTETDLEQYISLYPNPANNLLNIAINDDLSMYNKVVLRNTQGLVLMQQDIHDQVTQLDLSNLSSGIYFFTLESFVGNITKRVVKY